MYNNNHNLLLEIVWVVLLQRIILYIMVYKIKTHIWNILRLISTKFDTEITIIVNKCLITTNFYIYIVNKPQNLDKNDNIEGTQ